jgi:calreticulin
VDPDALKPADWDEEEDGEWISPTMPNPDYKGPWRQKTKPNPQYKGPWVEPTIPNPDYETDDSLCKFIYFYFRTCTGNSTDGVFL